MKDGGMDSVRSMQLFVRTVELGSFSRVAQETGLSQPTVSRALAALEKRLGAHLLSRSTRHVRPTEIGNRYYLECRKIIESVAQAEGSVSHLRTHPTGLLRVSVPMSFGRLYVMPHVVAYLERNPDLRIELAMNSQAVDLIRDGFDLAIQTGHLSDSRLIARRIGKNHRVMVATPQYLRKHGKPETPSQLSRHNCILAGEPWQLQNVKRGRGIDFSGNLRVNNAEGVREAVLLHLGIGILPLWAVYREIESDELRVVLPRFSPVAKDIYAVYPYTLNPTSKVRGLIAFLEDDLKRVNYYRAQKDR
jgi:DNA-binding transcriptional LysR family regulator